MSPRHWQRELPPSIALGSGWNGEDDIQSQISGWEVSRSNLGPSGICFHPLLNDSPVAVALYPVFTYQGNPEPLPVSSPLIDHLSWDWMRLVFSPLEGLEIGCQIWLPAPFILCVEFEIQNVSEHPRKLRIDLACETNSGGHPLRIVPGSHKGRPIIGGYQNGYQLLAFAGGNPELFQGPRPVLRNQLMLTGGDKNELRWVSLFGDESQDLIQDRDRALMANWEGEISFRKIRDQTAVQIWTGNDDWDFLLALSQKEGERISKQIEDNQAGMAAKPGITPLQAITHCQALVPLPTQVISNLLDQVFSDPAWQESPGQTPPILGIELLWQLDRLKLDPTIWRKHLPTATQWLDLWLSADLDRDGDGIPNLIHPGVFNLTEEEGLDPIKASSQFLPFPYLESPGLAAVLINELIKLTDLDPTAGRSLTPRYLQVLSDFLEESWDPGLNGYPSRDSQSHISQADESILATLQPGLNILRVELPSPSRVGLTAKGSWDRKHHPAQILLHGLDWKGQYRIEEIQFTVSPDEDHFTSTYTESVFQRIDYVLLEGMPGEIDLMLYSPGTFRDDLTMILPFWMGNPDPEKKPTHSLLRSVLEDRFLTPHGLCSIPGSNPPSVQIQWNIPLVQALQAAGNQELAYDIFSRWMKAALVNIRGKGGFFPAWHGNTGEGFGLKNSLGSLLPIRLLFSFAGIELTGNGTLEIKQKSFLPEPIKIRINGYQVTRDGNRTWITTPDSETRTIEGRAKIQLARGLSVSENFIAW